VRRRWTDAEVATLRARYADELTATIAADMGRTAKHVYMKAHQLGLHKSAAFLASAGRFLKGVRRSPATEFAKGMTPWNKGTHYVAGGRSAETRFRKGNVSKRWDPEAYAIGALRINADGCLDMKVRTGPRAWDSLSRWTWEHERGPIPKGYAVRFHNRDTHDCRIENLYLTSRADLMRENTVHNYPKPIARAILMRGALMRQINKREGHGKADR
jgi:hypothetical protein